MLSEQIARMAWPEQPRHKRRREKKIVHETRSRQGKAIVVNNLQDKPKQVSDEKFLGPRFFWKPWYRGGCPGETHELTVVCRSLSRSILCGSCASWTVGAPSYYAVKTLHVKRLAEYGFRNIAAWNVLAQRLWDRVPHFFLPHPTDVPHGPRYLSGQEHGRSHLQYLAFALRESLVQLRSTALFFPSLTPFLPFPPSPLLPLEKPKPACT